jgi:hypothetical protein
MPSDRKPRRHTITPETPPETASPPTPDVTTVREADNERRRQRATDAAGRAIARQKHASAAQRRVDAMPKRKRR